MDETGLGFIQFLRFERIPLAVAAVAIAWLLIRALTRMLEGMGERFTKRRLLLKQLAAMSRFLVFFATVVFVASTLVRFSNEALLALGGTAALAFGFAFKDILASLMAGIILLFDRPFQVGDRIAFEGYYGEVIDIGLRSVRMNTLDDNVVRSPTTNS